MAFVHAVVLGCRLRGGDAEGALRKAQITPDDLQQADGGVSPAQFERLCAAAMQSADDEALGWFERPLPWGSYGMLARAASGAPNLGVALRRWCRCHGLLTRDVVLTLGVQGDTAHIALEERRPLPTALRAFALISLLRNVHGLACWWIDAEVPLHAAAFAFAAPAHAEVLQRLFPGPVTFGAGATGLRFAASTLAQPLRRDPAALDAMLRRALPLMVLPYRRERQLAPQVRRQLALQPAATAATLARALGLSERSLHRRLAAEGARLQALKDAARRERASELLLRTRQPIKQVAQAVGFAGDKSFLRAFRAWTGQTPEQFRAQAPSAGGR